MYSRIQVGKSWCSEAPAWHYCNQHASIDVSADKFVRIKMNIWNNMNGITVITERISYLRLSNFEEAVTTDIVLTTLGTSRLGIQIESGSPAPIGQNETKIFPAQTADKRLRCSIWLTISGSLLAERVNLKVHKEVGRAPKTQSVPSSIEFRNILKANDNTLLILLLLRPTH
jgi:hypothetical protein